MPGRNGTGPRGMGQMTGRGMGNCAGNGAGRGFGNGFSAGQGRGCGYGFGGRGMGMGMNMGAGYAAQMPVTPIAEKEMLTAQAEYLSQELEGLKKRLTELNAKES